MTNATVRGVSFPIPAVMCCISCCIEGAKIRELQDLKSSNIRHTRQ